MSTLWANSILPVCTSSMYRFMLRMRLLTFCTVPHAAHSAPVFSARSVSHPLQFGIPEPATASDALQHLESDPVPVSAKRVYVGCRHRWPDQEIGNAGTSDGNGPGEFWESNSCQGSMVARSRTDSNCLFSARVGPRRMKTSNHRSMHSFASRSITGSAAGDTTDVIEAP
jgi:hypothetical protein